MTSTSFGTLTLALAIAANTAAASAQEVGPNLLPTPSPADAPAAAPEDAGYEVLSRGPVHEAFAEAVTYDPTPGLVVSKRPPEAIEELPPSEKPEGENVVWIPGYWAWEDERSDFLWVSGVWRNVPPDRRWVPGYWTEVADGFQWISGFWAAIETEELSYLPTPPDSLENGPSIAAPSDDYFWIPGCWLWQSQRYVWRPGYWSPVQENWTWVPARYCYTPRGAVYLTGYWDYALPYRGVLFAPVYFNRFVYTRPNYYYTPYSVVNLSLFTSHLFVWPRYHHYCFGDYYGSRYAQLGVYPWFRYGTSYRGYDPLFSYYRWQHRGGDRGWYDQMQQRYKHLEANADARPPRNWSDFQRRDHGGDHRHHDQLVQRYDQFRKGSHAQRFDALSDAQRRAMQDYGGQVRDLRRQRGDVERAPSGDRSRGVAERDRGQFRLPKDAFVTRQRESSPRPTRETLERGLGPGRENALTPEQRAALSQRTQPGVRDLGQPPRGESLGQQQRDAQERVRQQFEQRRNDAARAAQQQPRSLEQRGFSPRGDSPPQRQVDSGAFGTRGQQPNVQPRGRDFGQPPRSETLNQPHRDTQEELRRQIEQHRNDASRAAQQQQQQPASRDFNRERPNFGTPQNLERTPPTRSLEQRGFGPRSDSPPQRQIDSGAFGPRGERSNVPPRTNTPPNAGRANHPALRIDPPYSPRSSGGPSVQRGGDNPRPSFNPGDLRRSTEGRSGPPNFSTTRPGGGQPNFSAPRPRGDSPGPTMQRGGGAPRSFQGGGGNRSGGSGGGGEGKGGGGDRGGRGERGGRNR